MGYFVFWLVMDIFDAFLAMSMKMAEILYPHVKAYLERHFSR